MCILSLDLLLSNVCYIIFLFSVFLYLLYSIFAAFKCLTLCKVSSPTNQLRLTVSNVRPKILIKTVSFVHHPVCSSCASYFLCGTTVPDCLLMGVCTATRGSELVKRDAIHTQIHRPIPAPQSVANVTQEGLTGCRWCKRLGTVISATLKTSSRHWG